MELCLLEKKPRCSMGDFQTHIVMADGKITISVERHKSDWWVMSASGKYHFWSALMMLLFMAPIKKSFWGLKDHEIICYYLK